MKLYFSKEFKVAAVCVGLALCYSPQILAAPGGGESPLPTEVQQAKKITGVVSDAAGPVIGASVVVKGTSNGAATDLDGRFSLNVQPGQTLVISYIGYITKEVKVGAQSHYDITIEEDRNSLEEVVVVGYGTMKKSDLSGSSASIGEAALKGSVITSLDQSLHGHATGVTAVTYTTPAQME